MDNIPKWMANLTDEDMSFIKNFVLSSGSLKEMSQMYQVSYPTMRIRLNKLIEKLRISDNESEDPFVLLVKSLAIDDKYDVDTCLLYTSPSPRDRTRSRMPSSA